jgi:hypothetical protein
MATFKLFFSTCCPIPSYPQKVVLHSITARCNHTYSTSVLLLRCGIVVYILDCKIIVKHAIEQNSLYSVRVIRHWIVSQNGCERTKS